MKSNRYSSDRFVSFLKENPVLAIEIERLHREGERRLYARNFRGALRCFHRILAICPFAPIGHNNAGACYFFLGKYEIGAKHFQATLEDYPNYVFALAMLARCQAAMGDRETAAGALKRAVAAFRPSNPYRDIEANSVELICEAFAELEDDRGLFDFFRRYGGNSDIDWGIIARAGVAAFNLGRYSQAKRYWQRVIQRGSGRFLSGPILAAELIDQGRIPAFRLDYDLGPPKDMSDPSNPDVFTGTIKAFIVEAIWEEVDKVILGAFQLLAQNPDPWAEKFLWAILDQAELSVEVKTSAAAALSKRGLIAEGESFQMNVDGLMRSVTLQELMVPAGIDPKAFVAYQNGHILQEKGDFEGAQLSFLESLANDPDFVPARLGLIAIYQEMGELKEAQRILRQIDVAQIDEEHRWFYWVIFGNQAIHEDALAVAEWALIKALQTAPDEIRSQIQQSIENIRLAAEGERAWIAAREADRRYRLLNKPAHPDMSLGVAYHNLTKDNLLGMGKRRGLRVSSGMNKDELVKILTRDFEHNWAAFYESLTNQEREALAWLHDQGGIALFDDFESKYGDPKDTVFWQESEPTSTANRLWSLGWIGVGTWWDHTAIDVAKYSREDTIVQESQEQVYHSVVVVLPQEVIEVLGSIDA